MGVMGHIRGGVMNIDRECATMYLERRYKNVIRQLKM
jgi:hypothetical protein